MASLNNINNNDNEYPKSKLEQIFAKFQAQMDRIDLLEQQMDEKARRCRRRITNILESASSYRSSHVRVFVAHQCNVQSATASDVTKSESTGASSTEIPPVVTPSAAASTGTEWILQIEGRLLAGNIDYESAEAHDRKTGYVAPTDDLDRSKGEKEEEEVNQINFTHFFERVTVSFQTVFAPTQVSQASMPMAKKKSPAAKKSSRRSINKSPSLYDDTTIDPRLLTTSDVTIYEWNKDMTEDSFAFLAKYSPPEPSEDSQLKVHSVLSTALLYPVVSQTEPMYRVSAELSKLLFPHHAVDSEEPKIPKRKAEDSILIPNDIHVPTGLRMREITQGFFLYIQEHKLYEETDRSLIVCNSELKHIFNVDSMHISQLQKMLLSRDLIRDIRSDPVRIQYTLKADEATNAPTVMENVVPSLLQFDMDIQVPNLFPFRARELLRRIKRRELEYTSARTKARYLLQSRKVKDEEEVKTQIERVIQGRLYEDAQPVLLALAKAAPPHTEARRAAHLDARMSFLLSRLVEEEAAALEAWERVQVLQKYVVSHASPSESP
jgi:hypothetical protein